MDDSKEDPRQPHKPTPFRDVSLEQLREFGVTYQKLDPNDYESDLAEFRKKYNYNYSDQITINRDLLPNYDAKIKTFFEEHLHTDDEVRFILDGAGYFDLRNLHDEWVRVLVEPGDLLCVPAGIYHRFTVDANDYIKAMRLFAGEPVWTPHNRPSDDMPARKSYVHAYKCH